MTRTNLNIVLKTIAPLIESKMKEAIEAEGLVYTGQMKNSVKARIEETASSIRISVGPDVKYSGGRGPGRPPSSKTIQAWIDRKGIQPRSSKTRPKDLAFLIARSIGRNGTLQRFSIARNNITTNLVNALAGRLLKDTAQAYKKDVEAALNKAKPRDARN